MDNGEKIESIKQNYSKQSDVLLNYRVASLLDCQSLFVLVNNAYHGESTNPSCSGEDSQHEKQRTSIENLVNLITNENSMILVFFNECETNLIGSLHLYHKSAFKTAYFGMITVRPDLQGRGYGTFILTTGETYAVKNWNVQYTELMVLPHQINLIAYYGRRGYVDTSRSVPHPMHDVMHDYPKIPGFELLVLKKCMKKTDEKELEQM